LTRVGVTGHQVIPASAIEWIRHEVEAWLLTQRPLVCLSSLAAGADQIVAVEALRQGGSVEAVLPCQAYETTFDDPHRVVFRDLLARATAVDVLPFTNPSEAAFMAAGEAIVAASDVLLAIWDGKPAAGLGGTGDVVKYANEVAKPVHVIWPPGLRR
jgi:predicted Rossmann fold nucleotide-binding protein DprA/Smf involved in DNA uptake